MRLDNAGALVADYPLPPKSGDVDKVLVRKNANEVQWVDPASDSQDYWEIVNQDRRQLASGYSVNYGLQNQPQHVNAVRCSLFTIGQGLLMNRSGTGAIIVDFQGFNHVANNNIARVSSDALVVDSLKTILGSNNQGGPVACSMEMLLQKRSPNTAGNFWWDGTMRVTSQNTTLFGVVHVPPTIVNINFSSWAGQVGELAALIERRWTR